MSLTAIGSIEVRIRRPSFVWVSDSSVDHRKFSASGVMQWPQALQCSELANERSRRETVGDAKGVREVFVFDDDLLSPLSGWYLLESFNLQGEHQWSGHGVNYPVAFSMSAAYVGDLSSRVAVLTVAPMTMASQYGITPQTFVAIPPSAADAAAGLMRVVVNGVESTRRYDPDINS